MRATVTLVVGAALCTGCGRLGGWLSSPRVGQSFSASGRPCAWLPDEIAQIQLRRSAVNDKLQRLVVPALQASELDAWLLVERGYQRDPMFDSLGISEPGDKAVLLIDGGGTQPRAFGFGSSPAIVAQLSASGLFERVDSLSPDAVHEPLALFQPRRIGIDYSGRIAPVDGIATGTRQFAAWLVGREYAGTFRSAEALVVALRAARTPGEIELARQAARCAAEIADRALSEAAVDVGHTTAAELAWRILGDIHDARLDASAPPHVSVVKLDGSERLTWPWPRVNGDTAIGAGDLVDLDFDVRYAGVASVVHRTAYVLRRWERDAPADLRHAFDTIASVRAGLAPLFRPGINGGQIAADASAWATQNHVVLDLSVHPVGATAVDVGTMVPVGQISGPYEAAGALGERPLQEHETHALAFRVTVRLDNGRQLTLSASDDGVVGFGGLDFLAPPVGLLVIPRS